MKDLQKDMKKHNPNKDNRILSQIEQIGKSLDRKGHKALSEAEKKKFVDQMVKLAGDLTGKKMTLDEIDKYNFDDSPLANELEVEEFKAIRKTLDSMGVLPSSKANLENQDAAVMEYINEEKHVLERLKGLVEDLKKKDQKAFVPNPEIINVDTLLKDVVSSVAPILKDKGFLDKGLKELKSRITKKYVKEPEVTNIIDKCTDLSGFLKPTGSNIAKVKPPY